MNESAPVSADSICPRCGLKIGQVGSFTYWIFKDDRCQCAGSAGSATGAAEAPPAKQVLNNRYELIECVGSGAMGYVYKGIDLTNGELVALKIMRPELAQNELAVKRLMREVAVVSSLSNSNLGQVHGYGQEKDGAPYLVMEFVEGQNLSDVIKSEGRLKVARALEIFIQICSGLMCAHTNGIIHRDLKPSNVIIQTKQNGQDRVAIVDFGFARLLRDATDTMRLTQQGEAFGSPAYMSPEQCLGEELDVRSDIYSVGCLMYETLTGNPPLLGDNVLSTVAKQVRETPLSMRVHNPSISQEIDDLVLKCLNKEPVHRYQKAMDLRQDLERIKSGEYVVNAPARRAAKSAKANQPAADNKSLRSTEEGYRKFASLAAMVLIAAILLGGITGGVVWFVMQKTGTEQTARSSGQAPVSVISNEKNEDATVTSKAAAKPATKTPIQEVNATTVARERRPIQSRQAPHGAPVHQSATSSRKPPRRAASSSSSWNELIQLREHK